MKFDSAAKIIEALLRIIRDIEHHENYSGAYKKRVVMDRYLEFIKDESVPDILKNEEFISVVIDAIVFAVNLICKTIKKMRKKDD